jgi:hypothetical protein
MASISPKVSSGWKEARAAARSSCSLRLELVPPRLSPSSSSLRHGPAARQGQERKEGQGEHSQGVKELVFEQRLGHGAEVEVFDETQL